jgi:hypothetical protein
MATNHHPGTYLNCLNSSVWTPATSVPWGHSIRCSHQVKGDFHNHRIQRCLCMASSKMASGAATVLLGPPQLGARQRTAERTMGDGVSFHKRAWI